MRRSYCKIPPLKLHFIQGSASILTPPRSVKMAPSCVFDKFYEQLVLKVYPRYSVPGNLNIKNSRSKMIQHQSHMQFPSTLIIRAL